MSTSSSYREHKKKQKEFPTSLRLPGDLRDFIIKRAEFERRTMTWMILDVLYSWKAMHERTGRTIERRRTKAFVAKGQKDYGEPV